MPASQSRVHHLQIAKLLVNNRAKMKQKDNLIIDQAV